MCFCTSEAALAYWQAQCVTAFVTLNFWLGGPVNLGLLNLKRKPNFCVSYMSVCRLSQLGSQFIAL